jgi:hypothetical protein
MSYDSPPPSSPGQPWYPEGPEGPPPGWRPQTKGFFGALFDFSFNNFVTPAITRVLYILGLIVIVIIYLTFVITSFLQNAIQGVLALLFGLIISFIYLALWRVVLEFFLAVVRMSEDIHRRGLPGGR